MRPAKTFLYLVYVLIVGGLLLAIILSFGSSKPKPARPVAKPTPAQQPASPAQPATPATSGQQSGSAQTGTGQTPSGGAAADSNLSNSGPGDTISLFVAVSAGGALAYHWRLRRASQ